MKLRFLTSVAGERYNYNRTQQGENPVEVPDALANEFLMAGYAVRADDPHAPAIGHTAGTATAGAATMRRPGR